MQGTRSVTSGAIVLSLCAGLAACGDGGPTSAAAAKDSAAPVTSAAPAATSAGDGEAPTRASASAADATPEAAPEDAAKAGPAPSGKAQAEAAPIPSTRVPASGTREPPGKPAETTAAVAKPEKPPEAPRGPVAGKPWQVVASAQADAGYKCNAEYPHKFTAKGGTNVTYPDGKPRGACSGTSVAVTIPFVPTAAGPCTVVGTLSYGICDEAKTSCLMKKKDVTLAFTAGP